MDDITTINALKSMLTGILTTTGGVYELGKGLVKLPPAVVSDISKIVYFTGQTLVNEGKSKAEVAQQMAEAFSEELSKRLYTIKDANAFKKRATESLTGIVSRNWNKLTNAKKIVGNSLYNSTIGQVNKGITTAKDNYALSLDKQAIEAYVRAINACNSRKIGKECKKNAPDLIIPNRDGIRLPAPPTGKPIIRLGPEKPINIDELVFGRRRRRRRRRRSVSKRRKSGKGQKTKAMHLAHSEGISLKAAWAQVKGGRGKSRRRSKGRKSRSRSKRRRRRSRR